MSAPAQNNPRRRKNRTRWVPIVGGVLVLCAAVFGTLVILNDGKMPWSKSATAAQTASNEGKVSYPRSMRSIPAFTSIGNEHILDPGTGATLVIWEKPEKAKEYGWLTSKEIRGRVLRDDKPAGYTFTERDFLPPGSRDSWTAAIPAGMTGTLIDEKQIPTLIGYGRDDRFTLVASTDVRAQNARGGAALPADLARQARDNAAFDAATRVIVDDGVVIMPLRAGTKKQGAVAVPSEQYQRLLTALASGAEITAFAKSGNPLVQNGPLPEAPPVEPGLEIRVDNGGRTQTVVLPADKKPGGGP